MSLRRAKTADEYIEWVKQAVFEVGDLRACMEFEMEETGQFPGFVDLLEQSIMELYQSMKDGKYQFGREDLAFMGLVHNHGDQIPFATLLKQINETHRKGMEVDSDDD